VVLVREQHEEEHLVGCRSELVDDEAPELLARVELRLVPPAVAQVAAGQAGHQVQERRARLADAIDLHQLGGRRVEDVRERAEALEERVRDWLHVLARHRVRQQQLEDLVVLERAESALVEAVAKSLAMALEVGHRRIRATPSSREAAFCCSIHWSMSARLNRHWPRNLERRELALLGHRVDGFLRDFQQLGDLGQ
jgi:hypothetical protein